jgi:Tfp pilus assembly protein PilN
MINILSPEQKRDIRAARINVVLVRYCVLLALLVLLTGLIYGAGFWVVMQEKTAATTKIESQSAQAKAYAAVEKEADAFRGNLTIAKNILGEETSYSNFLTTLAASLPNGTILTSLSIGAGTATDPKGLLLDARTNNYDKVLELKNSLEQSPLFENVNIVSTSRPSDISTLTGLQARYPYEATFNVKLSKVKAP